MTTPASGSWEDMARADAVRAATPGDRDRGRELATARAMLGEFIDEVTRLGVPDIARAWLVGHDCSISLAVLRALAEEQR